LVLGKALRVEGPWIRVLGLGLRVQRNAYTFKIPGLDVHGFRDLKCRVYSTGSRRAMA